MKKETVGLGDVQELKIKLYYTFEPEFSQTTVEYVWSRLTRCVPKGYLPKLAMDRVQG